MQVDRVGCDAAPALAARVWRVYDDVFADQDEESWRSDTFDRHTARPDFRLAIARDAGEVVGFAYGYTGHRGEYWPDRVVEALGPVADTWVGGHFEFVELAVLPAYRRRGIGGDLHDALMSDLPHQRALLSTAAATTPAVRLYRSRGWERIGLLDDDVQVMGRRLPR